MSSSLPALDDLQTKARRQSIGQSSHDRSSSVPHPIPVIGPASLLLESEPRENDVFGIFRNCTTVFQCKSRFKKEDLPVYQPLHRQLSSPTWGSYFGSTKAILLVPLLFIVIIITVNALLYFPWYSESCQFDNRRHEDQTWYRDAVFYEIFPASFQDTDSDGYGDFKGIIQHLDYIKDLGMSAIRLNSIFSALDYPLEFEHIIDLRTPDPHLGRQREFVQMVQEAHARGLKVVLELNPTVTSDQYTWALHWQRGIPGYEHFYASFNRSKAPPEMENSEGPPPEDWELTQRTFGGHYLLNWSNPLVQEEYQKVLQHWIDLGIDGIYMKHLDKINVLSPSDIPTIIRQWRKILDRSSGPDTHQPKVPLGTLVSYINDDCTRQRYRPEPKEHRILMVSSKFADDLAKDLDQDTMRDLLVLIDVLDYPILVGSGQEMADQVAGLKQVASWSEGWPVPMWHLGSSDTFRMASRIEPRYQMAAFYLLMTLPGASSLFYGDEVGLRDSFDVVSGRVYRGGQLTPMQWTSTNSTSGDFTDNTTEPWLPPNPNHLVTNVQHQRKRVAEIVRLVAYKRDVLKHYHRAGQRFDVLEPNVVVLERSHKHLEARKVLLAANFGNVSEEKDFPDAYFGVRPVMTTSGTTRTRVRSKGFTVSPGAAFVAEVSQKHLPTPMVRRELP